ncbi:MAG TPA: protein phosphatase 2C domain-containing protein [Micromonosporaceae bacterium]|nr:protein phosphatase 2C domain-containing protein [Micromonosporaceae bacterium]
MSRCPVCATPANADDRFCEACGHHLIGPEVCWLSSTGDAGACVDGRDHVQVNGSCQWCGQCLKAGDGRVELSLGAVAGITDRGRHRRRNEDAVAVGHTDTATAAVVCDGVSSSSRPDAAARAAVDAGIRTLLRALSDGMNPSLATHNAARAAVRAVVKLGNSENRHNPPSCTYVSMVVTAADVTVGWIGDSRAYWLAGAESARSSCLTVDDTLAGQLQEAGVRVEKTDSHTAALTRWVGADARDIEPRIKTFGPPGSGRVLLCTDGLSRYLSTPHDLAVAAAGDPPEVAVRRLTQLALDAGGHDNITVVVTPFPPAGGRGPRPAHSRGETNR